VAWLTPPRRFNLGIFPLDLFDQQTSIAAPLITRHVHQFGPGPVQMVSQEEDFPAQAFLV
jgi:hypothetical protein